MPAFAAQPFLDCFALAALGLAMTGNVTRHCEEPRKRRQSTPVSAVPKARRAVIAALPFLDCFALASLGLAMTGKGVGLAMTVKGVRLAMTGKVRAGAQWREKSRAGAR